MRDRSDEIVKVPGAVPMRCARQPLASARASGGTVVLEHVDALDEAGERQLLR